MRIKVIPYNTLEYASRSVFPVSGESNKNYLALDTMLLYAWNTLASEYVPAEFRYEGKPTYHGSYLKSGSLEFQMVASPTPIDWHNGDYIRYSRTNRVYKMYGTPQIERQARTNHSGESFAYRNVMFYDNMKQTEIVPFRDYVVGDNQYFFSSKQQVETTEPLSGIVARLNVNLSDFFGEGVWQVRIAENIPSSFEIEMAKDFSVSGTCFDALNTIFETWHNLGWAYSVENNVNTITLGYPNIEPNVSGNRTNTFSYGNGLNALKRNAGSMDNFCTRMHIFGTERNLINRYYNSKDIYNAQSVHIPNLMIPIELWGQTDNKPDASKAYIEDADKIALYGLITKDVYFDGTDGKPEVYPSIEEQTIALLKAAKDSLGKTGAGAPDYYPQTEDDTLRVDAIKSVVTMPLDDGSQDNSGEKYVDSYDATIESTIVDGEEKPSRLLSTVELFEYTFDDAGIVDVNWNGSLRFVLDQPLAEGDYLVLRLQAYKDAIGRKPIATIDFDAISDVTNGKILNLNTPLVIGTRESQFTGKIVVALQYTYVTNQNAGVRTITITKEGNVEASVGLRDAMSTIFRVKTQQIGFDISKMTSTGGATLSMKSGLCAGRDFPITKAAYNASDDSWTLTCKRTQDNSIETYFPNSKMQIKPDDLFVILGITMPEEYIIAQAHRLANLGQELFNRVSVFKPSYEPTIDSKKVLENIEDNPGDDQYILLEGKYMSLYDPDIIGGNHLTDILITELTINEDESEIATYSVVLSNKNNVSGGLSRTVANISSELQSMQVERRAQTRGSSSGSNNNYLLPNAGLDTNPIFIRDNTPQPVTGLDLPGRIHTADNVEADGGMSSKGIGDLPLSPRTFGSATTVVFDPEISYEEGVPYVAESGIIVLPAYPSLTGLATQSWVSQNFAVKGTENRVSAIEALIPSQATVQNQLADKSFVASNYAHSLDISNGYLRLMNNASTPAYLSRIGLNSGDGLVQLSSGKIPLSVIPDVILGQLMFGGYVNASGVATLSTNAKTKLGITADTVQLVNEAGTSSTYGWVRFEGVFFLMSANSSFAGLSLQTGDWLISTGTQWGKIDNTDAVTGVKGDNESTYRIGNVNITKGNIGLGDVENTKLSTWAGTSNITTLGTITTGVWHGTKIAKSYLADAVQTSLGLADTSIQGVKVNGTALTPSSGVVDVSVPTALSQLTADATHRLVTDTQISAWGAKYDKPSGGIPKSDLASAVQSSLASADSAVQIIWVNGSIVPADENHIVKITDMASATTLANHTGNTNNPHGVQLVVGTGSNATKIKTTNGNFITVPYATKAAQLYTSRTLWGQSFDGTQNVSGDMTGVGSITASGNIVTEANVMADGGVSAKGISDLSIGAGGGGTATSVSVNGITYVAQSGIITIPDYPTWGTLSGKPTLATVATSGNYNDLSNKPSITARLQVSDTTNKKINTMESTGNYIQFVGGTNKFTVKDGTSQFDVAVTPSITNNVTGSGTSGCLAKFNGANTITDGPALGSDTTKFLRNDGSWVVPAGTYSLPLAANGTRGGVQIGFTTDAANRNYAVQLSSEKMYVNVPWTDTDTKVTSAANHYTPTSDSYTPTAGSWSWNSTEVVVGITKDSKGHIVGVTTTKISNPNTNTTYTIATGDSNGQIKVTPSSGNAYNVAVKGLGDSAYVGYDTTVTQNSTNLITSGAVFAAIDNLPEPMVMKGTLGTNGTITSLPTASSSNEGFTYKVITAGTYASQAAKVGDVFVSCKPVGASAYEWILIPAGDTDSDTWRNIKVNGTQLLGTAISTGAVNFKNGGNITLTGSGNDITLGVASGYAIPTTAKQTNWDTAYTHATDASRLTTAKSSGFYKFATTAEGHIASVTEVAASDLTSLIGNTTYAPYHSGGYVTLNTEQTITGTKTFSSSYFGSALLVKRSTNDGSSTIQFTNNSGGLGFIGFLNDGTLKVWNGEATTSYKIWHEGNSNLSTVDWSVKKLTAAGQIVSNVAQGTAPLSIASTTLVSNLNAEYLGGTKKADLFSAFTNDNEQVSATIGGTNKNLTIDYATKALRMKQESLTAQEFTFRNSPKTIDTDSVKFDRILGRTLTWNQNASNSYSSEATYTLNGTTSQQTIRIVSSPVRTSHRFYSCFFAKSSAAVTGGFAFTDDLGSKSNVSLSTAYSRVSMVSTINRGSNENVSVGVKFKPNTTSSAVITTKCFMFVDLTLMFGAGNEPNAAQFEAWYEKYYSYNKGQLINNSAEGLETVGFNLWDEVWEMGTFDNSHQEAPSTTNIRSKHYIEVFGGQTYYFHCGAFQPVDGQGYADVLCFDEDKKFIQFIPMSGYVGRETNLIEVPSNGRYIRFVMYRRYGTTYNHDICINLSDPAKNGTYEPYKRVVTELNLKDIRVKSPNIWDEEWEVGYYNDSGSFVSAANYISSPNYIDVEQDTTYNFYAPNAGTNVYWVEYDDADNFLRRRTIQKTSLYTPSADCKKIRFSISYSYASYGNDICINKSDPAFNGRYFPHGVLTFVDDMRSAGNVCNEICNGGRTYIRKVDTLNLGDKNWTYQTVGSQPVFYTSIPGRHVGTDNLTCQRYCTSTKDVSQSDDKVVVGNGDTTYKNLIYVKDSSYSSSQAANLKSDLSGIYINYELENYETYELVEPIPMSLPSGTTERRLPADTQDSVIAPFVADMTYGTNNGDVLTDVLANRHLINHYVGKFVSGDKLLSNGIEVVNLSDAQALTNKTYNGLTLTKQTTGFTIAGGTTSKTLTVNESYTLGAACAKGYTDSSAASAISTGTSLVTERDVYYGLPTINGAHNYTSGTTIYAPTGAGTSGQILKSTAGTPEWINQSAITAGKATQLETTRTLWGQDFNGAGNVSGDMSSVGHIAMLNNKAIYIKDTSATDVNCMTLTDGNNFSIGYGAGASGYNTHIFGQTISFYAGTALAATIDNDKNLSVLGDVVADGGMAAKGISDLSVAGGSHGEVTSVQFDTSVAYTTANPYTAQSGLVKLPAYPSWSTLSGRPTLATVATSGNYNDLSNKPTSKLAAQGGTELSLVYTGEKWNWDRKSRLGVNSTSNRSSYTLRLDLDDPIYITYPCTNSSYAALALALPSTLVQGVMSYLMIYNNSGTTMTITLPANGTNAVIVAPDKTVTIKNGFYLEISYIYNGSHVIITWSDTLKAVN